MIKICNLRHLLLGIISSFLLVSASFAQTTPTTFDTDFQLWNETHFIVPLNKKKDWNAVIAVVGRLGNEFKTTTDARISVLITKKVNNNLTIGGGYLYRYSNATFTRKRYESRYLATAIFTVPFNKKWALVNRNIYQYEDRYSRPNASVVRNRLWLKREVTVEKKRSSHLFRLKRPTIFGSKIFRDTAHKLAFHTNSTHNFRRIFFTSAKTKREIEPVPAL